MNEINIILFIINCYTIYKLKIKSKTHNLVEPSIQSFLCTALSELDPTQIQAILENLVHMKRRFDQIWPPKKTKSDRAWDGQINSTSYIRSELMKATKGTFAG